MTLATMTTRPVMRKVRKMSSGEPQKIGGTWPRVAIGMGCTAQLMDVTPQLAEQWLQKNPQVQRKQNRQTVAMISRLILAGEWRFNGQPIIFNSDGKLADGQHRLAAIANCRKTVTCLILYNVPVESFATMDSGRARTPADSLRAAGYSRTTGLAAAAGLLYRFESGFSFAWGGVKISPLEIDQIVKSNPKLQEAHKIAAPTFKICRSDSVPTFCFYVFSRLNRRDAEAFFDKFGTGEELAKGHPILELRRKLIDRPPAERTPPHVLINWVFRTWNAVRKNEPLTLLRIGTEEKLPKLL